MEKNPETLLLRKLQVLEIETGIVENRRTTTKNVYGKVNQKMHRKSFLERFMQQRITWQSEGF